eukprot:CAMPEP_0172555072 /NCGR_PEP_ID=MMETSP1067-20121228/57837_1 /TAXON_ID=265564 ORGANISM="Thalassiosira punctigera, Strain Tpunct2005C2" /NCGR_SAMPLE_ID=MMETSP1067 /ASSEMBLY_ACC=CAM_ASM_000444 /LENGTH=192 /DNA_ID=CAMNT_0013343577 /DNA_START=76 /DNA_END=654 /DNA_ORIENTATION=+
MVRSLCLTFLAAAILGNAATTAGLDSLCNRMHPENLPDECICSELENLHVLVQCVKSFNGAFFDDTLGIELNLDVCNDLGSTISLDVTELNHNIDHAISAIRAGEEKNIPIPGLSVILPHLGSFGVDTTVVIAGNPDRLRLKVGLNACSQVHHKEICLSDIPGLTSEFPWYILEDDYSFGDICNSITVAGTS